MRWISSSSWRVNSRLPIVSVCLPVSGTKSTQTKKEKTEKHKKAESGYAKRLQGNLQGENENEESENEYIIFGGLCRLCLCLEQTHTHTHKLTETKNAIKLVRWDRRKRFWLKDEEEWHSWELASFLRARWMWLKKKVHFLCNKNGIGNSHSRMNEGLHLNVHLKMYTFFSVNWNTHTLTLTLSCN